MKDRDRYLKIVEWSEEDDCYVGTCPGLFYGGVHGSNELKVYRELCKAVVEWIAEYRRSGDPLPEPTGGRHYSGKFIVRVGPDLHKALSVNALKTGESLNEFCQRALREAVAPPRVAAKRARRPRQSQRR